MVPCPLQLVDLPQTVILLLSSELHKDKQAFTTHHPRAWPGSNGWEGTGAEAQRFSLPVTVMSRVITLLCNTSPPEVKPQMNASGHWRMILNS
ncbi:hypothetical protein ACRRTK_004969 [Alexandromys fortis]